MKSRNLILNIKESYYFLMKYKETVYEITPRTLPFHNAHIWCDLTCI